MGRRESERPAYSDKRERREREKNEGGQEGIRGGPHAHTI